MRLGATQFPPAIRRPWPAWQRLAGRLAVVGAALVVVSALWLTVAYATHSFGGLVLAPPGGGRLRDGRLDRAQHGRSPRTPDRHHEWMIRAHALGIGAATPMLFLLVTEIISGGAPTELNRALLMGLGWGINLIVAGWSIRRGRLAE